MHASHVRACGRRDRRRWGERGPLVAPLRELALRRVLRGLPPTSVGLLDNQPAEGNCNLLEAETIDGGTN